MDRIRPILLALVLAAFAGTASASCDLIAFGGIGLHTRTTPLHERVHPGPTGHYGAVFECPLGYWHGQWEIQTGYRHQTSIELHDDNELALDQLIIQFQWRFKLTF